MSKKTKPKRRLVRGVDWHAWAWKHLGENWPSGDKLCWFAEPSRRGLSPHTEKGRWVRVKFVEVA